VDAVRGAVCAMKVLVTGATGAVGPRVVMALHDGGFRVRTLSLDPPPAGNWPHDIETRRGDVTVSSDLRAAMEGVESVVHLAALLHIVNPPPALQERYERINVGGTAKVVEAALQAGVRRIVYFSTIAVYGPTRGQIVAEDTPAHPDTVYARTKYAAEQIVLGAKEPGGVPVGTVLRLGAVYGAGIKGNYERLTQALARHRFLPVGNGSNRRTLIYDKDVARAALLAVSHPAAAGRVFNVTDGEFHTLDEIIDSICAAIGRRPPRWSLPLGVARFVASAVEGGFHMFGLRSPVTPEMLDKYTEDIAVIGSRIQNELRFRPQYDLRTGWAETIGEMRRIGHLK
jgi:nucleoside-diphosphate-sugar epimerase